MSSIFYSYFDDATDNLVGIEGADDWYYGPNTARGRNGPKCRTCGAGDLRWKNDNGRWRLTDTRGEVHVCNEKAVHQGLADDFDVL